MISKKEHIKSSIHLGSLIKEKLDKSGLSVTEFADKIGVSRPAVYQMFQKQSIDSDLLLRISLLLKENFFKYFYWEIEETLNSSSCSKNENSCLPENGCPVLLQQQNKLLQRMDLMYYDLISIKNMLLDIKSQVSDSGI